MAKLLYADADDEIADLVSTVKGAAEIDVALVVPQRCRAFQTPLNVRLLSQSARNAGKHVSIVSDDARIQQMARSGGFATFASVAALERGVETLRPSRVAAAAAAAIPAAAGEDEGGVAVAEKPAAEVASVWSQAHPKPVPPRPLPPRRTGPGGPHDRKPLYFAAVALAVVGVLVFLFVAPSAQVSIAIAATPLSVNPVIQGSSDANAAKQGDHVLTQVVNAQEAGVFQAAPTGNKQLPALASTASVTLALRVPSVGAYTLDIPQQTEFDSADGSIKFVSTEEVCATFGPSDGSSFETGTITVSAQPQCAQTGQQLNGVPLQAATAGAKTNVPAGSITRWPNNPCDQQPQNFPQCQGQSASDSSQWDVQVNNGAAASGGTDAKTVTIASQQDITTFQTALTGVTTALTAKLAQDISAKTNGEVVAKDPGGGGQQVTCTPTPALPNAGDQFNTTNIKVTCTEVAATYSVADIQAALHSDLQAIVPGGEVLAPEGIQYSPIQVTQSSTDGTVIFSARATGYSRRDIDFNQLKPQLAGKACGDLKNFFRDHSVDAVSVQCSEKPFSLPVLPFFSSRITLTVTYQAANTTTRPTR